MAPGRITVTDYGDTALIYASMHMDRTEIFAIGYSLASWVEASWVEASEGGLVDKNATLDNEVGQKNQPAMIP